MRWTLLEQLTVTLVLLMLSNIRFASSLKCYTGVSHKNVRADGTNSDDSQPTSVECPRKLADVKNSVDYYEDDETSVRNENITFQRQSLLGSDGSDDSVANCLIFYDAHLDNAEFGCDSDNVCNDASERKMTSVCYNGIRGALYCCQGDECNTESYMKRMSPPQAATICYSGTNNGTVDIGEVNCKSSWCYQSSTFLPNGHVFEQSFGCDVLCDDSDLELTTGVCREHISHSGLRRRTCYCSTDRCNSMIKQIDYAEVNAEPPYPPTDTPIVEYQEMYNPEYSLEYVMKKRWFVMTTCVIGGISCLLFILLMTLAVLKCQQKRARRLSISYVRLDDDKIAADPEISYGDVIVKK